MKTLLTTLTALAAIVAAALLLPRGSSAPVPPPAARASFLVRFGIDAKPDTDWSGSMTAKASRLAPWQFSEGDALTGNAWKCATRTETYWDTPYERRMRPT